MLVLLLAQPVGQPGHLLAGGGPEPAHFLVLTITRKRGICDRPAPSGCEAR